MVFQVYEDKSLHTHVHTMRTWKKTKEEGRKKRGEYGEKMNWKGEGQ